MRSSIKTKLDIPAIYKNVFATYRETNEMDLVSAILVGVIINKESFSNKVSDLDTLKEALMKILNLEEKSFVFINDCLNELFRLEIIINPHKNPVENKIEDYYDYNFYDLSVNHYIEKQFKNNNFVTTQVEEKKREYKLFYPLIESLEMNPENQSHLFSKNTLEFENYSLENRLKEITQLVNLYVEDKYYRSENLELFGIENEEQNYTLGTIDYELDLEIENNEIKQGNKNADTIIDWYKENYDLQKIVESLIEELDFSENVEIETSTNFVEYDYELNQDIIKNLETKKVFPFDWINELVLKIDNKYFLINKTPIKIKFINQEFNVNTAVKKEIDINEYTKYLFNKLENVKDFNYGYFEWFTKTNFVEIKELFKQWLISNIQNREANNFFSQNIKEFINNFEFSDLQLICKYISKETLFLIMEHNHLTDVKFIKELQRQKPSISIDEFYNKFKWKYKDEPIFSDWREEEKLFKGIQLQQQIKTHLEDGNYSLKEIENVYELLSKIIIEDDRISNFRKEITERIKKIKEMTPEKLVGIITESRTRLEKWAKDVEENYSFKSTFAKTLKKYYSGSEVEEVIKAYKTASDKIHNSDKITEKDKEIILKIEQLSLEIKLKRK